MKTANQITPKLRFPEFSGEWEKIPMGTLYSFKANNSFSRDQLNYISGVVKNIHYGDIHTKYSSHFYINKENVPYINPSVPIQRINIENYCIEGDMIFADASEDMEDIGKSIELMDINGERLLSGLHTILARQKINALAIGFGGHLFKSAIIRDQIKIEAHGTKVLGISSRRLSNINIFYPANKLEQQKIADCLSSLDDLITAENKKLDALKTHKKGLMQQLFPAEGETVPRLRFPEFSGEWISQTLVDVASVRSGATPLRSVPEFYVGGSIPWVKTADLTNSDIYQTEEKVTKEAMARINPVGSVLVAMYGGFNQIGRTGLLKVPAATNQAISVLNIKCNLTPEYLLIWLNAKVDLWKKVASSSRKDPNITSTDVANFYISYPPIPEQQKIADFLSSVDELISAQIQKIDALKTHKKGLMQQLFPVLSH